MARTVLSRWRHARVFGLGDRAAPESFTPGLCLTPTDPEMAVEMAPFMVEHNSEILPATLSASARGNWAFPFGEGDIPIYNADEGHTLPPSLQDASSGQGQSSGPLLPVSWQRLVHDPTLLDSNLTPEIIVLQDAVQLAGHPGRLVQTIHLLRERFPGSLIWAPGLGGPDNCAILSWFGLDLFDLRRSQQAVAAGVLLSRDGPRHIDQTSGETTAIESQLMEWQASLAATRAASNLATCYIFFIHKARQVSKSSRKRQDLSFFGNF